MSSLTLQAPIPQNGQTHSKYSTDAVSPDKEIMLMLTDGGGGHNITCISAQVSQICLSFN